MIKLFIKKNITLTYWSFGLAWYDFTQTIWSDTNRRMNIKFRLYITCYYPNKETLSWCPLVHDILSFSNQTLYFKQPFLKEWCLIGWPSTNANKRPNSWKCGWRLMSMLTVVLLLMKYQILDILQFSVLE